MPFTEIEIPTAVAKAELSADVESLIDEAYTRIESFMLADQKVIENFVNCDFHLLAQSIDWIAGQNLMAGNRVCELGSGFGVAAMLGAMAFGESIGIEIEPPLVEQARLLAESRGIHAQFFCGSFVPRGVEAIEQIAADQENVTTDSDDVFDEIGLELSDFDLFFAFPWPGEQCFFEQVVESCGSDGALLLTYRGRDGMQLQRKG